MGSPGQIVELTLIFGSVVGTHEMSLGVTDSDLGAVRAVESNDGVDGLFDRTELVDRLGFTGQLQGGDLAPETGAIVSVLEPGQPVLIFVFSHSRTPTSR